ncbi:LEA type 2 family protein [Natrinema versiforme]|uniref:Water stress and hypersensitive response domain-containing protein n=1 Tax=Natrinema versiforme JCM 10478 TaxID=1227496 RepID=L9Y4Y6_9EURY|nr:LEA type 2 family protein [Natrinema versiforme]ELY68736.1 hypothetical protein C489_06533 [Natrinema versiforme JCM 10478]
MGPSRRTWTVILVAIVLLVAAAGYGLFAVDRPQVESVDNEWGTVTDERTEVETTVTVDNPRLLRVGDAAADISYTVRLNGIDVATGSEEGLTVTGRESEVSVSTWIDNDEIPDWWTSHVANDETTTVRIDPEVAVDYAGVQYPADRLTRTRTVQTDLLEPLRTDERREFRASGQTLFVVEATDARWGNATENRTPIDASATVTNPTALPIPIAEIGYTVRLNGIVVGQGVAGEQVVLSPDSTQTLEAGAAIDTDDLDEWWVTHVRNDETSNLSVEFNATLEYGGTEREVPLDFLSYEQSFQTDLLGSAETGATATESGREPAQTAPQSENSSVAVRAEPRR